MATKVDIAGTNISASQMKEFWRLAALPESHVDHTTFQVYLERRDPFSRTKVKKLLKFIRPVSLPAISKFVAAEKFRVGETVDGIKVGWLGSNFKTNFLKKVEKPVHALDMREHELEIGSRDPAIIVELGGEEQVETFLAHFWEFLKTADQTLVHVRYIRDVNDVLWAVSADWHGGGLRVGARSLGSPPGWNAGRRFLSR